MCKSNHVKCRQQKPIKLRWTSTTCIVKECLSNMVSGVYKYPNLIRFQFLAEKNNQHCDRFEFSANFISCVGRYLPNNIGMFIPTLN